MRERDAEEEEGEEDFWAGMMEPCGPVMNVMRGLVAEGVLEW